MDIADFMNMEDDERIELVKMSEEQLTDVANVCNRYPSIEMEYAIKDPTDVYSGQEAFLTVHLKRDDDTYTDYVYAPYFPKEKEEAMWIVLGNTQTNSLLGVKKVSFASELKVDVKFIAPEEGKHHLNVYLIPDSWVGCD
mmetsp:Transcript_34325/g.31041  ORF Transcript_34325/g.31041 Transcript_34325/m.31041 type:complete len:140 (+) Transcript_34325:1579-1998(+)